MIVLRSIWFLIGVFITFRFGYFFVMEVGYGLSLCEEPKADAVWLSLAYSGAMILSARYDIEKFAELNGIKL